MKPPIAITLLVDIVKNLTILSVDNPIIEGDCLFRKIVPDNLVKVVLSSQYKINIDDFCLDNIYDELYSQSHTVKRRAKKIHALMAFYIMESKKNEINP